MDRHWLLTWTMYGNWLPGDPRGFVSSVSDGKGGKVTHNIPGTPFDEDWESLNSAMLRCLKQQPIRLDRDQANTVLKQFHETASYRGWQLIAAAVMANHCHIVVGVRVIRNLRKFSETSRRTRAGRSIENGVSQFAEPGGRSLDRSKS